MRKHAWLIGAAAVLGAGDLDAAGPPAPPTEPLAPAWEQAATFLYNDAYASFGRAQGQPAVNERERQFGEAITSLNIQPRTSGNIGRARQLFEGIIAGGGDDEAGIFARYFLARVHQCYEEPPQLEAAARLYWQLLAEHAGHPMAEAGAATLVMMELYDDVSAEERARRFSRLEEIGPMLKTSGGRRDYHLSIGGAYLVYDNASPKALEHLLAADAEGISRWQTESITWVTIAERARDEGRSDLALKYYGKFIAKYQRDNRRYTVQQRMDSLLAAVGK